MLTRSHFKIFGKNYGVMLLVLFVVIVAVFLKMVVFIHDVSSVIPLPPQIAISVATTSAPTLPEAEPNRLIIPKINLDTTFTSPLGVMQNGEIEVPNEFNRVGWYKYSPTPGELGPSIILGHVSSLQGPGVFFDLKSLTIGDEIRVERADGTPAVFIVETMEEYAQSGFPTERVYGNIAYAGLRLVTCAGSYDEGTERFSHNLVVYARLKE